MQVENRKEERSASLRKFRKTDLIFLLLAAAVIAAISAAVFLRKSEEGGVAVVTIAGEEYGRYSLDEDQEIPICIDGIQTNLLIIQDGKADMTEADCPDQICVDHTPISKENETIICLPNKVVVQIEGGEASETDAVAN